MSTKDKIVEIGESGAMLAGGAGLGAAAAYKANKNIFKLPKDVKRGGKVGAAIMTLPIALKLLGDKKKTAMIPEVKPKFDKKAPSKLGEQDARIHMARKGGKMVSSSGKGIFGSIKRHVGESLVNASDAGRKTKVGTIVLASFVAELEKLSSSKGSAVKETIKLVVRKRKPQPKLSLDEAEAIHRKNLEHKTMMAGRAAQADKKKKSKDLLRRVRLGQMKTSAVAKIAAEDGWDAASRHSGRKVIMSNKKHESAKKSLGNRIRRGAQRTVNSFNKEVVAPAKGAIDRGVRRYDRGVKAVEGVQKEVRKTRKSAENVLGVNTKKNGEKSKPTRSLAGLAFKALTG